MKKSVLIVLLLLPTVLFCQYEFGFESGLNITGIDAPMALGFYGSGLVSFKSENAFTYNLEAQYSAIGVKFGFEPFYDKTQYFHNFLAYPSLGIRLTKGLEISFGFGVNKTFSGAIDPGPAINMNFDTNNTIRDWSLLSCLGIRYNHKNKFITFKVLNKGLENHISLVKVMGDGLIAITTISLTRDVFQFGAGYIFDPKEVLLQN